MKVLMSIKPPFVQKIFSGQKRWEYRRVIFKRPVHTVVVYASTPSRRIVGEFMIDAIITDTVDELWHRTGPESGMSYDEFLAYFHGLERGYAIRIGPLTRYPTAVDPWVADNRFHPPQSFRYVE